MAVFFGVAGGLTAIGPILGGYLSEWTWRAIFWVNVPVALVALVLIVVSRPVSETRPGRLDYRGLVLISGGVALSVLGLQQSAIWGWSNAATWLCIVFGAALLVVSRWSSSGRQSRSSGSRSSRTVPSRWRTASC